MEPVLVLEFGSFISKIGFAGELRPRIIYRSDGNVDLVKTYKKLMVQNVKRIVVSDPIFSTIEHKTDMLQQFSKLDPSANISFIPQPFLALIPTGQSTGLVIDVGYEYTTVVPIVDHHVLFSNHGFMPIGGKHMFLEFKNHVMIHNNRIETDNFFENLMVQICYFDTDTDASKCRDTKTRKFKEIDISPSLCTKPLDVLFRESDGFSIQGVIMNTIAKCDIDLRRKLVESLIITGGSAMFPGFKARLSLELRTLIETNKKFQKFGSLLDSLNFIYTPFPSNQLSWIGGSLLAGINQETIYDLQSSDPIIDWTDFQLKR